MRKVLMLLAALVGGLTLKAMTPTITTPEARAAVFALRPDWKAAHERRAGLIPARSQCDDPAAIPLNLWRACIKAEYALNGITNLWNGTRWVTIVGRKERR